MSLLRDPEHGHLVGIEQKPVAPSPKDVEFPKWIEPHPSHVVTDAHGNRIAQGFEQQHIDRVSDKLAVLVNDAKEEAAALAEKVEPTSAEVVELHPRGEDDFDVFD